MNKKYRIICLIVLVAPVVGALTLKAYFFFKAESSSEGDYRLFANKKENEQAGSHVFKRRGVNGGNLVGEIISTSPVKLSTKVIERLKAPGDELKRLPFPLPLIREPALDGDVTVRDTKKDAFFSLYLTPSFYRIDGDANGGARGYIASSLSPGFRFVSALAFSDSVVVGTELSWSFVQFSSSREMTINSENQSLWSTQLFGVAGYGNDLEIGATGGSKDFAFFSMDDDGEGVTIDKVGVNVISLFERFKIREKKNNKHWIQLTEQYSFPFHQFNYKSRGGVGGKVSYIGQYDSRERSYITEAYFSKDWFRLSNGSRFEQSAIGISFGISLPIGKVIDR